MTRCVHCHDKVRDDNDYCPACRGTDWYKQAIKRGDRVRCQVRGRRPFEATVLRVNQDGTVNVADPRNGGMRWLRPDQTERIEGK